MIILVIIEHGVLKGSSQGARHFFWTSIVNYSLLTPYYSLLTVFYSLLYSLLTVLYSLLYSLLSTHYSLLTSRYPAPTGTTQLASHPIMILCNLHVNQKAYCRWTRNKTILTPFSACHWAESPLISGHFTTGLMMTFSLKSPVTSTCDSDTVVFPLLPWLVNACHLEWSVNWWCPTLDIITRSPFIVSLDPWRSSSTEVKTRTVWVWVLVVTSVF